MLKSKNNLRILQGTSFIKGWIFCIFEYFMENKANMSFTYLVSKSLHNNATQYLFGECQLFTFHNINIAYTSIDAENHKILKII